jgi:hypothetical protein
MKTVRANELKVFFGISFQPNYVFDILYPQSKTIKNFRNNCYKCLVLHFDSFFSYTSQIFLEKERNETTRESS